jgi:hypothetical protein
VKPGDLIIVHDNFSSGEPTQIGVYIGYRVRWGSHMHTVLTPSGVVDRIDSELELVQSCEKPPKDGIRY